MRRICLLARLTAVPLGLLLPGLVLGQQSDNVTPQHEGTGRDESQPDTESYEEEADAVQPRSESVENPRPAARASLRRHVRGLVRLQTEMKRKLDLSRRQEEAIDGLFKDHFRTLRQGKSPPGPGMGNSQDATEIGDLRRKMIEAREAGDHQTVRRLREQFKQTRRARLRPAQFDTTPLFDNIAAQLDDEQRSTFQKLIESYQTGQQRNRPGGTLRALQRAVMSPDVDPSKEQTQAIRRVLRNGLVAVREAQQHGKQPEPTIAKTRAEVFEILTLEQRAKVEKILMQNSDSGPLDRPRLQQSPRQRTHQDTGSSEDKPN